MSGGLPPEIRMGNDIARQFGHLASAEEAAVQVGTHLEKFWEPRMRRRLRDLLADDGHADDADPLLVAGMRRLQRDETDEAEKRKATGG